MKKLAWIVFGALSILISFYPFTYYLADEPVALLLSKSAELLSSNVYNIFFYTHITFGGIALLIGWLQFSKKLRRKYMNLHRWIGKIYVVAVLLSGPAGFYIAFHATGGLSPILGFSIGALIWVLLTTLGYTTIRKGNVEAHKKWMMYSYAGTFGAVTLRLWLPILILIFGNFTEAYQVVAWLSWVPNLIVVYLILNKKEVLISLYRKLHIKKVIITTTVLAGITFLLSFASPQTWFYQAPSFKGNPLEKVTSLNGSSFTQDKLNEVAQYLKEESETTSMMVLENGKIVFEYGDVSEISYLASARKSILSMLYGKYVDNGMIDLQETIGSIGLDEDDGLLPIEKQATVEHLITARSGVFHPAANGGADLNNIKERGSKKPGEYFVYNNWDFNAAGYILEKKSGNSVYQELEQQLAIPLGFEDWNIENQSTSVNEKKSRYPAHHMHLSTRDLAKIGQLMLQEGSWKGKQLISKKWIQKTTTTVTPIDTVNARYGIDPSTPMQRAYSYMWWPFERFYDNPDFDGAYTASGAFGHFITIIPKRNVVIVHKTTRDLLTLAGFSNRKNTPKWRYWWILRNLMLNRKSISELAEEKSATEIIEFIKTEYNNKDSEYAISERLINEYGLKLAEELKHEDAIKFYELNLILYPSHGYFTHRIYKYYGQSLMALGRNTEALAAFEKALEFDPGNRMVSGILSKLKY
ncbi:DUF2306 domain-containing protein [Flavobacteriaceae bacterium S356]|uniref:DUF2306 domain-containing protein n=1 Tax=Asprobacillus argus TaxID=3076534 RepID=A0ABU3LI73_9FLAO|nr:DUF2306 domain-containing protein [Flavobacteriaceae bacterium S356]